ncbi:hypothetical protein FQZ97_962560 [compost metagenome]
MGSTPQIRITVDRITTATPMVTITRENIGSPSIGRMNTRSISRPSNMAVGRVVASRPKNPMPGIWARLKLM